MARKGWVFIGIGLTLLILAGVLLGVTLNRRASDWAYEMTGLRKAQGLGLTGSGVTVAVIDTGIDLSHPSLSHLRDRVVWRDLVNGEEEPYDDVGHGTSVVGILAGKGASLGAKFQGFNMHGAAPGISLIMVKAIAADGSGTTNDIASGIDVSVQLGADVICLSLGSQESLQQQLAGDAITRSIDGAIDAGIPVVAAAGNTGEWSNRSDVESPATHPDVIGVGSVNEDYRVSKFSARGSSTDNYGPNGRPIPGITRTAPNQKPEIVAPGENIRSIYSGQAYATASGTSQAVPFVCGAIALLFEAKPLLASRDDAGLVSELKLALMETSEKLQPEVYRQPHDPRAGYGLLRADNLLASPRFAS